ncbi:hypothetical protein [Streptomyces sp. NPDC001135]
MAQRAQGFAEAPCSTPPVHSEDAAASVHPVDEKPPVPRLVPAAHRRTTTSRTRLIADNSPVVPVPPHLFFSHLGTRSRQPAPALKSS